MSLVDVADETIFRFRLRFRTGNKRTTLRKCSRLPKREIQKKLRKLLVVQMQPFWGGAEV